MLSNYQLKIANFWNIPIGNAKKLVSILTKKNVWFIMKAYSFTWG